MREKFEKTIQGDTAKFPLMGLVLFNSGHAHLLDVLRTQHYIDALDEVTGNSIVVYWTSITKPKVRLPSGSSLKGNMGLMRPISEEPSANKELYSYFNISDGHALPLLITFTFEGDDTLLYRTHHLNDQTPEQAFNRLRGLLKEKSELIENFCDELKNDKQKMLKELDLFDDVNRSSNIVQRLILAIGAFRSASSL